MRRQSRHGEYITHTTHTHIYISDRRIKSVLQRRATNKTIERKKNSLHIFNSQKYGKMIRWAVVVVVVALRTETISRLVFSIVPNFL